MTLRNYVFLARFGDIEPGNYLAEWDNIKNIVKSNPTKCQQVSFSEGIRMLEDSGLPSKRKFIPKAYQLSDRCWYCGQKMNIDTVHELDSAEIEHQVPKVTKWAMVEREENIVVACHRCNNGAYPGKGERDVQTFRERLAGYYEVKRIVFYGDVLRWVRAQAGAFGWADRVLTSAESEEVLTWYLQDSKARLHNWEFGPENFLSGLQLVIPPDSSPFALGAPERLGIAPRVLGQDELKDDDAEEEIF